MPYLPDLHTQLESAREILKQAQLRVAELEEQLLAESPQSSVRTSADSRASQMHESDHHFDDRFRLLVEAVLDYAIYFLDTSGNVASWNIGAERLKQYSSEEILGQPFSRFFTADDQAAGKPRALLANAELNGFVEDEGWRVRKDGSRFWADVALTALRRPDGTLYGFGKITRDLTERKLAEVHIGKLLRTLSVLSDVNQTIVRTRDLDHLFDTICRIAVAKGGFRMAWIAIADPSLGNIKPAACAGVIGDELDALTRILNDASVKPHPLMTAIQGGKQWLCNDLHDRSCPDDLIHFGAGACLALPLVVSGVVRGLIHLYADEPHFFDSDEIRLMEEMATDVSFAIEVFEQDERRREAEAVVHRYSKRLEILHRIDLGIIEANSIPEIARTALQEMRAFFGCDQAVIALFDFEAQELDVFTYDLALPMEESERHSRLAIRPGLLDDFGTGPLNVIHDTFAIPDGPPQFEGFGQVGPRSILRALLMFHGRPIGILTLTAMPTEFFTGEMQQIAVEIANQLAIAVRQRQLAEALARHSYELEQSVTERTAALQASMMHIEAILNNSPDGILLLHQDQLIQQTNSSFNRLFNAEPDDYFGIPLKAIIDSDHADDVTNLVREAFVEGQEKRIEIRAVRKDGTTFEAELGVGPIKGNGLVCLLHDITERKTAQEALRQSEEKFRMLLDAAPVATIITNQTGRMTLVNRQTEALFGYSRDELIGELIELLVPVDVRERHVEQRTPFVTAPHIRSAGTGRELFALHKDNHVFPVEIELSHIETDVGLLVMSFIVDISERKRAADELERQRSFLRNVIDVSPSMIYVKDHDARFVLANSSVARMYNTTVEALVGKQDSDFNPSGSEVRGFLEADRKVMTSGEPVYLEESITNFTGTTAWFQTTKVPIVSADGKSNYVLGISTDITERKRVEEALRESEAKYRSLIDTMRGGLAIFDTDYRITYINDRFCEILGYTREETIGKRPTDFISDQDVLLVEGHLKQRRKLESTSYELAMRHKAGHPVHLLMSGSPIIDKNGEFNGSFVVVTDIAVQKQAEATLLQALAKERELSELKSRFVSMASHEFRTPLATILALVETLSAYRHQLSDEQIEQRFDKIRDQIDHLKDIMEDVLMLARIQARRVEFNPTQLDLDSLCRSVLDEFLSRPDINHRAEYETRGIPRDVLLDRKLIRQIISNLVSNALKYSPAAQSIAVSLAYAESSVTLTVRDHGIGIPEPDLPHLFEPFHRAANVGTISGTGLGLVITKEAVEMHGGTITVESQPDVGTTFTVQLPTSIGGAPADDENPDH